MKIKTQTTIIECSADELRQSNALADALLNALSNCFNGPIHNDQEFEEAEGDKGIYSNP